jgi:glutaredoxin
LEVILYSTKGCIHCDRQKEFMKRKGIEFREIDVMAGPEVFKEFRELGGEGTPLTIRKENGVVVSKILGFNEKRLSDELLT